MVSFNQKNIEIADSFVEIYKKYAQYALLFEKFLKDLFEYEFREELKFPIDWERIAKHLGLSINKSTNLNYYFSSKAPKVYGKFDSDSKIIYIDESIPESFHYNVISAFISSYLLCDKVSWNYKIDMDYRESSVELLKHLGFLLLFPYELVTQARAYYENIHNDNCNDHYNEIAIYLTNLTQTNYALYIANHDFLWNVYNSIEYMEDKKEEVYKLNKLKNINKGEKKH